MATKNKTYQMTVEQLKDLDQIRKSLYMLSIEADLPRPIDEQIHVAVYRLYYWMQQFEKPFYETTKKRNGFIEEWPDTINEFWESQK